MKPFLFVLLTASLLANVALVVLSRRSDVTPARIPAQSGPEAAALPVPGHSPTIVAINRSGASSSATATAPFVWPATTQTDQELQRVVAGLRAAGYPPSVIRAVINQLLNERYAARSPGAGQPFWKRNIPSPETASAQTAINNERRALFETLLGPDARPSAMMDGSSKERRYGNLSDDQIDAIARIERDYSEMTAEAYAKRRGNVAGNAESMMQTQQLMEKEKRADLASVLTPEELTQYEMRNSPAAWAVINNVRNVEVTEAEFTRLYQAQKAFEAANPRRTLDQTAPNAVANSFLDRQVAQLALNEEARAVLGDARFYSYLEGADGNYANTARALNKYPSVTPATSYQVYQLQVNLRGQMSQLGLSGQSTPEQVEAVRNLAGSYSTKLDTLLGPEVAAAYRNQPEGRIFNPLRAPTRSATTAIPLVPGVK